MVRQQLAVGAVFRPQPPVLAIITIVAHDEIVPLRHQPLALAHVAVQPFQDAVRATQQVFLQQGRTLRAHGHAAATVSAQFLVGQRLAVDGQGVALEGDLVARQADHALDPVVLRVMRRLEHHHVAALGLADGHELVVVDRQAQAIGKLVDQDEVADQQVGHHRSRRNLVRLGDEAAQDQHDGQHREERTRVVDQHRLFVQQAAACGTSLGEEQLVRQPDDASQQGQDHQDCFEPDHKIPWKR